MPAAIANDANVWRIAYGVRCSRPAARDRGVPVVAAPVVQVDVATLQRREQQRRTQARREEVERGDHTAGERHEPRHRPWRLPGQPHLAADIDAANMENAVVSIDITAFERQPLLRAQTCTGRDDRDRRPETRPRPPRPRAHDSKNDTSPRFGSGFFIFVRDVLVHVPAGDRVVQHLTQCLHDVPRRTRRESLPPRSETRDVEVVEAHVAERGGGVRSRAFNVADAVLLGDVLGRGTRRRAPERSGRAARAARAEHDPARPRAPRTLRPSSSSRLARAVRRRRRSSGSTTSIGPCGGTPDRAER